MKKQKFLLGTAGLLALGLTACSNELEVKNPVAEADESRFISVQISAPSDSRTRAIDREFQNGTENESYIHRLDFFFYDAAGRATSTPVSMDIDEIQKAVADGEAFFPGYNDDGENVTRVYTTVVAANLTQGQNIPSQVICIVNGEDNAINALKGKSLAQLIDQERTTFRTDSYFTMSNSVYYGQNILTGEANQRLCATPINTNTQLFSTKDEAVNAVKGTQDDDVTNDGAIVDIYVERLAAKVGLTMAAEGVVENYSLVNSANQAVTLTFVPQYWTMNATDKAVYLTKRYGVETSPAEYDEDGNLIAEAVINKTPDYTLINNALTGGETNPWWNAPGLYRSYWGSSPSYFDDEYPDVSDDVNDLNGYTHNYGVNYWSYQNISDQAARTNAGFAGIGKQALAIGEEGIKPGVATNKGTLDGTEVSYSEGYIYTYETTASRYRINDIDNSNPAAVVASAVIVGKYQVNGADVAGAFYIDRSSGNGIYYADEAGVKNTLAARQRILFTDPNGTNRLTAADSRLVIKHPDKNVREAANVKLAGRLVTLQLSTVAGGQTLYYYQLNEDGTGEYVQVTPANLPTVNAQLLAVGYMDMFDQGLAFYSVPIRHLNWSNTLYNAQTGYDWENMPSGALGVVRNHVYSIVVDKISGLATALRSPNQPIVPAKEETNQYIAARLNVLAWNVLNEWHVEL